MLVEDVMIFPAHKRQLLLWCYDLQSLIWPILSKEITICLVTIVSIQSRDLKYGDIQAHDERLYFHLVQPIPWRDVPSAGRALLAITKFAIRSIYLAEGSGRS